MSPPWLQIAGDELRLGPTPVVGIGIRKTAASSWHVGLLHVQEELPWFLHLAWHLDLRNECFEQSRHAWVLLDVPPGRIRTIAAYFRRVWKRNQSRGVPYGLRYDATSFHDDGRLLLGPTEHGLTCATFVIAVLRGARINLVDVSSWPQRTDDIVWHETVVETLRKHGAAESHIVAVEGEIGCARFRPLEVAGAASRGKLPAHFNVAASAALEISEAFEARA